MRTEAQNIWDTRIQGITGIVCARSEYGVETYVSATFAQVTASPPRLVINPNRTYGIENTIRTVGRFSINVMSSVDRPLVRRLIEMRRREPRKGGILGIEIQEDEHLIPFLPSALRTVFCEVEGKHASGDRRIYVANILESRLNRHREGERPLLYPEVSESVHPVVRAVKYLAVKTGLKDVLKRAMMRVRPPRPANIQQSTYELGGLTEEEVARVEAFGVSDLSRSLTPPAVACRPQRAVGICVVGTKWGAEHCSWIRKASPIAKLYVCGLDESRTRRAAEAVKADGWFIGLETAANDTRVEALSLALPHHLHRKAAELCFAAGKHVLVEKPIATSLGDADAMIAAAKRADRILMVAENMHYRPAIHAAVTRIDQGLIGEPLYMLAHAGGILRPTGWKRDMEKMGGGVLIDIGVHYVRAMRMIMGEPDKVFASRAMQVNSKMSGEDSVQCMFSSRFGWEAHMLLSWASHRGSLPDILVVGDQGSLALWPRKHFLEYYPVKPRPITRLLSYVRPHWLREKLLFPGLQTVRLRWKGLPESGYIGEMQDFLASITESRQPETTPLDARRDLEVVTSSYQSMREGRPTSIPRLDR